MDNRTIQLPATTEIKYGWVTFPEFRKPILEDGKSLWPERWPIEALIERRKQMGPIAWAQEMENNPVPEENSYFTYAAFTDCFDDDLEFQYEYRGNNPVFIGVDSQANPDPKKSSDYGCIFVFELIPAVEARRILWIERGRWGFRVAALIKEFWARYSPTEVVVENNNAQDFIIQHISATSALPITPMTTGTQKPDIYIGIPYLASTVAQQKWRIPRNGYREKEMTDQWIKECLEYGQGHTGDVLMASWFANHAAQKLCMMGLPNLPDPDQASSGDPDFKADHSGRGNSVQKMFSSPVISSRIENFNSSRGIFGPRRSPPAWRKDNASSNGRKFTG